MVARVSRGGKTAHYHDRSRNAEGGMINEYRTTNFEERSPFSRWPWPTEAFPLTKPFFTLRSPAALGTNVFRASNDFQKLLKMVAKLPPGPLAEFLGGFFGGHGFELSSGIYCSSHVF